MAAVRLFRSAACAWQTIFLVSALIMAASAAVSMDRRTQSALAAQGPAQAEEAPVIVTASGDPEALEPGMVRADVVAKNGELVRAQTAHKKNTSHIAVLARDLSISTTFSEVAAEGTIINLHPLTEADKKPMKFAFHSNFTGRGLDITAVITKTDAVRLREHPNDSTATLKTFNIRLVYNKGKITVATQSLNSDAYTAVGCDTFSSDEFYDSDDDELQVLPETEMKQLPAGLLGKCRDCNAYLGNLLGDRYVFLIDSTNHVQYMQGSDWAIAFTEFQHVEKNSNQQVSGAEALKKLAGSSFESLVKRCANDQPKLQALPNDDIAAIAAQIRADEGGSSAYPLFSSSSESSQKKSKQSSSSSSSKQSRATLIELDNSVESNQRTEVQGSCYDDQRGNGRCDEACNNAANHWDGGDCCRGTCVNGVTNTEAARRGGRVYPCGINGYNCVGSAYDKHCAFLHGFGLWGPAEAANKQWQLPNKDLNDAQVGQLGGAAKIPYNKMSVEKVETSSAGPTQDSFAHGTPALDGRSGWFAESALVKALGGGKGNPQDIALKYAGYWADMAWQLRGVCNVVSYQHANTYQFGWDHTQLQQDYADLAKQVNEYKPAKKEGVKHVGGEVFAHSMANNILAGACASSGQCTPWWSLSGGLRGSQAMNYNIFYRGHKHSVADKAKSRARTQRAAYSLTTVYAEPNKRDALVKEAQGRRAATVKGAAQGHGALIKGAVCGYSAWGSYSAAGIGLKALQDAAYPQAPCDDNVNGEACLRTYGDGVVHMSECALSATPTATSPQPWLAGQSFVRDDFRRKFFMWKGNHFGSTGNEHNANRFFDWLRLAAMGRLSNSNSVIFKPHKNPRLEKIKQQRQSHGK